MIDAIRPSHRENPWHINDVTIRRVAVDRVADPRIVDVTITVVEPDIVIVCAVHAPHRRAPNTAAVIREIVTVAVERVRRHRQHHPHRHHIIEANIDVRENQMHVDVSPHHLRRRRHRTLANADRQWNVRAAEGIGTNVRSLVPVIAVQPYQKLDRNQTIEAQVAPIADPFKP